MTLVEERAGGAGTKRTVLPWFGYDLFVVSQVLLAHLIMSAHGIRVFWRLIFWSLYLFLPVLVISMLVGVPLRWLWERRQGRGDQYLAEVKSRRWLISSVRIAVFWTLALHVYFWIKLLVPILNPRSFDTALWNLDRTIFFGMSPNIFFLNLFSSPLLIRIMDWVYANLFFAAVVLSFPFFTTLTSDRIRFAYASSGGVLWIGGSWMYLAVPSLGPAFRYPDVWGEFFRLFHESRYWQYRLLKNYLMVLDLRRGVLNPKLDIMLGVAAFPSMHVAFQTFVALWVMRFSKRVSLFFFLLLTATFLGSIVTGWHYLIDSLTGLAWGALCYWGAVVGFRLNREVRDERVR